MSTNTLTDQLKQSGLRQTRVRHALVKLLSSKPQPCQASEIVTQLQKSLSTLNKTTVYRQLMTLEKNGFVVSTDFGDGKKRYELKSDYHHHHLVCTICSNVDDVVLEDDLKMQERVIAITKQFKVERHNLEFFGLCAHCQSI